MISEKLFFKKVRSSILTEPQTAICIRASIVPSGLSTLPEMFTCLIALWRESKDRRNSSQGIFNSINLQKSTSIVMWAFLETVKISTKLSDFFFVLLQFSNLRNKNLILIFAHLLEDDSMVLLISSLYCTKIC